MRAPGEDDVVLTFSGEIYNFTELRRELAARGHHFRTRSDTEVLLHGYLEWGADCVRLWVPKTCAACADVLWAPSARSRV